MSAWNWGSRSCNWDYVARVVIQVNQFRWVPSVNCNGGGACLWQVEKHGTLPPEDQQKGGEKEQSKENH